MTFSRLCVIIITVNEGEIEMETGNLLQTAIWEFERLLRKSKAKNITEKTRVSIVQKIDDIENGIEYIIKNRELDKRTIKIILPKWEIIREKRYEEI